MNHTPFHKVVSIIHQLVECGSIRATSRITGHNKDTIQKYISYMGNRCELFLEQNISGVPVTDVQADEMWGFVRMKEKQKRIKEIDSDRIGDAYTFVAIERNTKLLLAWHLGRRTFIDTLIFLEKVDHATSGIFQLTVDGFAPYSPAVEQTIRERVNFAHRIKLGGKCQDYLSGELLMFGEPDPLLICSSHIERFNLTMRNHLKRLTRHTIAFSKKWENLQSSLALFFAYYNFCLPHAKLKCAPAFAAGLTDHTWSLSELLAAAVRVDLDDRIFQTKNMTQYFTRPTIIHPPKEPTIERFEMVM